ncbi:MAG: cyclic nucleotide-binding domain-containing protein, partial [Bacteroidales bacterium]|nr:cyclic nucleotide-binding domain-containing protein [Bacteroidales bacterium]
MDNKTLIAFLKKIELFRDFDDEEYQLLTTCIKQRTFKTNELLFKENGPRESIFIIYEGEVELFKANSYGVELKLTRFGEGDFLGEGSWATDSPHSTSAKAMVRTIVLVLHNEVFSKSATTTLKIFSNITRVILRRMR